MLSISEIENSFYALRDSFNPKRIGDMTREELLMVIGALYGAQQASKREFLDMVEFFESVRKKA